MILVAFSGGSGTDSMGVRARSSRAQLVARRQSAGRVAVVLRAIGVPRDWQVRRHADRGVQGAGAVPGRLLLLGARALVVGGGGGRGRTRGTFSRGSRPRPRG